jgi:AcrR family transcriptional regulator
VPTSEITERGRPQRRREIAARLGPAVEQLLADGGTYSELSVPTLIEQAGTSRSRFYVYFDGKGDLLMALTEDVVRELFQATLAWWSLAPAAVESDLRGVTAQIFAIYRAHRHFLRAVAQVSTHDAALRDHFARLFDEALDGYAERIARGQADGSLDPGIDAAATARLLSSMTESGLHHLTDAGLDDDAERWLDALTRIIWNTVYLPARDAGRDA